MYSTIYKVPSARCKSSFSLSFSSSSSLSVTWLRYWWEHWCDSGVFRVRHFATGANTMRRVRWCGFAKCRRCVCVIRMYNVRANILRSEAVKCETTRRACTTFVSYTAASLVLPYIPFARMPKLKHCYVLPRQAYSHSGVHIPDYELVAGLSSGLKLGKYIVP